MLQQCNETLTIYRNAISIQSTFHSAMVYIPGKGWVLNMIPRPSEYVEIFSKHSFIF